MEQFKYASIPLEHETLTREQVAERLVKAAKEGGYKTHEDSFFGELQSGDTHFVVYEDGNDCIFHIQKPTKATEVLTLEQFEAHCKRLSQLKTPNQ